MIFIHLYLCTFSAKSVWICIVCAAIVLLIIQTIERLLRLFLNIFLLILNDVYIITFHLFCYSIAIVLFICQTIVRLFYYNLWKLSIVLFVLR